MSLLKFKNSEIFKITADKVFHEQKDRILKELSFVQIEQIGGTAIPGLLTKGDLDINVRVEKGNFNNAVETLKGMYEINQPNNWTKTYASFKDDKNLDIDFGVQVTVIGSPDDYFILQRDALLQNTMLVTELNSIKEWCESNNLTMDEYRKKKGEFFERIIREFNSSSNFLH